MKSWAKIRGAYVLSRRNIARIIAAIAAAIFAFHTSTAAISPAEEALSRRAFSALDSVRHIEDSMPSGVRLVAVSDRVFDELAEVFFTFRHLLPDAASPSRLLRSAVMGVAKPVRRIADGFTAEDRRMLRQIHRASVFGETPTEAQVAGDVRRQQVLYGVKLYKPSSKYVKGVSSYKAASEAIKRFKGRLGAYKSSEKKALAMAITREWRSPKG